MDAYICGSGDSDWIDTDISLENGQPFSLVTSGEVNPCANVDNPGICIPHGPGGIFNVSSDENGPLPGAPADAA